MNHDYNQEAVLSEERKLSKINSAGLVNSALHNLWLDFWRHYRQGKYLSASADMDCVWTILGGEKTEEGGKNEERYYNIEKSISETGSLQDSLIVDGFGSVDQKQLDKLSKQKVLLLKKALFLRKLQNSQGKGTAYYDQDDDDFD